MEINDFESILMKMKENDKHYCYDCNEGFHKYIKLDDDVLSHYVCPYCYSTNCIDKLYMIKQITVEKTIKNSMIKKERKNFNKFLKKSILIILIILNIPFFELPLLFGVLFYKINKWSIRKLVYKKRYKELYGVDLID